MKNIISASLLAFVCFVGFGCTSLTDRADKLFENEAYEEAAGLYEQVLIKSPDNDKVRISLNKTRLKIIDRKLIQVRKFRLAGDQWQSTNQLLQLLDDENKWQHYPKGPVAFTQKEEADFSTRFIKNQMNQSIEQDLPLKALFYQRTYATIFSLDHDSELGLIQSRINKSGEKQCLSLIDASVSDHFFYQQFAKKYCDFWSVNLSKKMQHTVRLPQFLYKSLVVEFGLNKFPPEDVSVVNEELSRALKASPWYSADSSQTLAIKVTGEFAHEEKSARVQKTHSYNVKIPYTESHTQKKSEPPKDGLGQTLALISAFTSIGSEEYTSTYDNKDGTETVTEHKIRNEPRFYNYSATEYVQKFSILMTANSKIMNSNFNFDFHDQRENQSFEHYENLPDIGLSPHKANLILERDFVSEEAKKIADQMIDKLKDQWKEQFCRISNQDKNVRDYSEVVFRCMYAELTTPPSFIDDWFIKNIGLKTADARNMMQIGFVK